MKWEYKMVYVGIETSDEEEYEARLHEGVHTLNKLGSEGWELIAYLPHQMEGKRNKYHVIMKRPLGG